MKNKKLYAALLVGTMVVGMMGSTVMASGAATNPTGDTTVTYNSGTITPPDPVNPDTADEDPNNWAVTYDRSIMLADSNIGTGASEVQAAGAKIRFEVKQKVAGADGKYDVTDKNIGAKGLSVQTTADDEWTNGTNIAMDGTQGTVEMQLANSKSSTPADLLAPGEEIVNLLPTTRTSDSGYAALTEGSDAKDGITYTKTITWTVSKKV